MPLAINQTAPGFTADTTEPVAKRKPEFDKRGVKVPGLSVDPVANRGKWALDIEKMQGSAVNFPMIGDADLAVTKLHDMLPADASGIWEGRTPADKRFPGHTIRKPCLRTTVQPK